MIQNQNNNKEKTKMKDMRTKGIFIGIAIGILLGLLSMSPLIYKEFFKKETEETEYPLINIQKSEKTPTGYEFQVSKGMSVYITYESDQEVSLAIQITKGKNIQDGYIQTLIYTTKGDLLFTAPQTGTYALIFMPKIIYSDTSHNPTINYTIKTS